MVNNTYKNSHFKNKNQLHIIPNISDVPHHQIIIKPEGATFIERLPLLGIVLYLKDFTYRTTSEMGIIITIFVGMKLRLR